MPFFNRANRFERAVKSPLGILHSPKIVICYAFVIRNEIPGPVSGYTYEDADAVAPAGGGIVDVD